MVHVFYKMRECSILCKPKCMVDKGNPYFAYNFFLRFCTNSSSSFSLLFYPISQIHSANPARKWANSELFTRLTQSQWFALIYSTFPYSGLCWYSETKWSASSFAGSSPGRAFRSGISCTLCESECTRRLTLQGHLKPKRHQAAGLTEKCHLSAMSYQPTALFALTRLLISSWQELLSS